MTDVLSIVNDIDFFLRFFKEKENEQICRMKDLKQKYNPREIIYDCSGYYFELDGIEYDWNYEELENKVTHEILISGKPLDFVNDHDKISQEIEHDIEGFLNSRGWMIIDIGCGGELEIEKDGWKTTISYWPSGWEDVDSFIYDPDEPGYYEYIFVPFEETISAALIQLKMKNCHFNLSDFEKLLVIP